MIKVAKFGGSSVADPQQIGKVLTIINNDPEIEGVVISGPGKSAGDQYKVTDHLENIAQNSLPDLSVKESIEFIIEKFKNITDSFGLQRMDETILQSLKVAGEDEWKKPHIMGQGEIWNSIVFSKLLPDYELLSPEKVNLVVESKADEARLTGEGLTNLMNAASGKKVILPGYVGITKDGKLTTLGRGGSDISGDFLAYAIDADIYQNWTDQSGILNANPNIIPDARVIDMLTYVEARLLSSKGFNVLHPRAMQYCRQKSIPINVRNTNDQGQPGSIISASRVPSEDALGLARLDNLAYIHLEKFLMDDEVGFLAPVLDVLADYGISTHHYPTDRDEVSIFVDQKDIIGKASNVEKDIQEAAEPDSIRIEHDLSLIALVGEGMRDKPGISGRATEALARNDVNIEAGTLPVSQRSVILGVKQYAADRAYEALYEEFFR